jgi:carbonic anhydrase/acetyltransferase-like protein (isoleucine patch superfamily)
VTPSGGKLPVRLVRRGRVVHPFGLGVDQCGLGAGTFASYRESILEPLDARVVDAGLDDEIAGPALVWSDDVFVTRRCLRTFLRAVAGAVEPVRLCLPKSRLLELFLPLQDVDIDDAGRAAFELAWLPAGRTARPRELFALGREQWRAAAYRELLFDLPSPRYILKRADETMSMPFTSAVAMRVRHWVHVLRAGHLMPQVTLLERAMSQPLRSLLRALTVPLRVLASGSLSRASLVAALRAAYRYRGRGTFVHPTATVEASVIGDGVTIGAYAYVTNSVIGNGCVIEQRAHVSGSSLGPRTFVSLNSSISACATFGDTDACINGVQACVIAQRCGLTSFARPLDLAVEGQVRVEDDGTLREVGELPCGVAFGPGVFCGADVVIAAGRAIPADVRLYVDGKGVLQRLPSNLAPGSYAIVDGKPLL